MSNYTLESKLKDYEEALRERELLRIKLTQSEGDADKIEEYTQFLSDIRKTLYSEKTFNVKVHEVDEKIKEIKNKVREEIKVFKLREA